MNVRANIGMSGRYRVQARKNGRVMRDTGWFKNLITDNGLNLITTNSDWHRYCSVGSSSASPDYSDVALGSRIATVGEVNVPTPRIESADRYLVGQKVFTFSAGTATGNIAEIGVGSASGGTSLFSRALVMDSMGSPTTITVLADEDLVVIYELWVKQPTGDFPFDVGGVTGVIRACQVNSTTQYASQRELCWRFLARATFTMSSGVGNVIAWSGSMGDITSAPTGTMQYPSLAASNAAYVNNSHTRTCEVTYGTAAGNTAAIKSIGWVFGCTCWQLELDDAITKTNLQTLKIGFQLSWSRDDGPSA